MANTIRIKRRASGASGAPSSLANAELAFSEVDDILYYGKGTGGAGGSATTVEAIGGKGAVVMLTGNQTVAGVKTFSSSPVVPTPTTDMQAATKKYVDDSVSNGGGGDMLKSVYDQNDDGKVDVAEVAESVDWDNVNNKPSTFAPSAHNHDDRYYTESEVDNLLSAKAPLNSPAFTGNPTAPTQDASDDSTKIATTAFVKDVVEAIIGAAPEALDTLKEIADALGEDPDFAGTVTTELGKKLAKASNLSDLTDASEARVNLGLGSMAVQAANNVNITGGSIDGVTFDGGTF